MGVRNSAQAGRPGERCEGTLALVQTITQRLKLISFPPRMTIATSTFQSVLTLTAGNCSLATEPEIVEGFLDRIMRELVGVR